MIKKQQQFIPKGMNQDIAETKVQSDLAHSIKNLRIVTDEDNGTLALVTEKGTQNITLPNSIAFTLKQSPTNIKASLVTDWRNYSTASSQTYQKIDIGTSGNSVHLNFRTYMALIKIEIDFKYSLKNNDVGYSFNELPKYFVMPGIMKKTLNVYGNAKLEFDDVNNRFEVYDINGNKINNTYIDFYNYFDHFSGGDIVTGSYASYSSVYNCYRVDINQTTYFINSIEAGLSNERQKLTLYIPALDFSYTIESSGSPKLLTTSIDSFLLNSYKYQMYNFDKWNYEDSFYIKHIIGDCVIDDKLFLFIQTSKSDDNNKNAILKVKNINSKDALLNSDIDVLYLGNLNFNVNYPIQTYVSYESKNQQRIYWIDGLNQPRVINVADDVTYEISDTNDDNHFNFCTPIYLKENINITKKSTGGFFHSGVIQYFITYVDKNQQESKIFYQSPLYYLTSTDRALPPDKNSTNSFIIEISNANANQLERDKLRIYSIHRSSIDAVPVAKLVYEIKLEGESTDITVVDTGNIGMNIDPQIILMAGCDFFVPQTLAIKDNTIFFGNIKVENNGSYTKINELNLNFECVRANGDAINSVTSSDYNKMFVSNASSSINKYKSISLKGALFKNDFQLNGYNAVNSSRCYTQNTNGSDNDLKTFMYQEEYMLGIQLLHKNGEWSQPIWVGDFIMDKLVNFSPLIEIPIFQCFYSNVHANTLLNNGYIAIRPLVVCNEISTARVICQGVVNPVLYDKNDNSEFTGNNNNYSTRYISSWFFRPVNSDSSTNYFGFGSTGNEFAGDNTTNNDFCKYGLAYLSPVGDIRNEIQNNDDRFCTSNKIVSFNSPEIEFEKITELPKNIIANKIGYITIQSLKYDLNIQTSTIPKKVDSGFNTDILKTKVMHYKFKDNIKTWCTFLGGLSWEDEITNSGTYRWYTYPWENDQSYSLSEKSNEDIVYGAPLIKTLTNWRYSQENWYFNSDNIVKKELKFSKIVNNNYTSIESFIYEKDVDKLLTGIYGKCDKNCFKAKKTSSDKTQISSSTTYYTEAALRAAYPDIIDVFSTKHSNSLYANVPQAAKDANVVFEEDGDNYSESGGYYEGIYVWYTWSGYTKNTSQEFGDQSWSKENNIKNSCTRIQYKSTPHAILSDAYELLPNTEDGPFQSENAYYDYGKLSLVSLLNKEYDNDIVTHFKGRYYDNIRGKFAPTQTSMQENIWYVAGDIVKLEQNTRINVKWEKADAYFQKYHCLKTYPYSHDAQNSIIDILSFMIYTRVNLNGCYDDKSRNDILHIDNNNFNKLNEIYNQTDNFFVYHVIDESNLNNNFSNLITWSKQKTFGESIDPWTNIHLLNILDLDGNLGEITALKLWNNKLIAFQNKGINVIKYNENTMLQPINGAPIEIANSNKVSGKEIISNQFGCQNKWSIVNTKSGLYFSDDYNHKLYVLSDGIKCISDNFGFKSYLKNKHYSGVWKPNRDGGTTLHTFYDQQLGDIYFTDGVDCLTYNETLNLFTAFYDYKNYGTNDNVKLFDFVNIKNKNYWIVNDFGTNMKSYIHRHRVRNDLFIFGDIKNYEIELTANIDPHLDKIFDTVEIRGDSYNTQTNPDTLHSGYGSTPPFDKMRVTNEYQDTNPNDTDNLTFSKDVPSNVKQKFRIWRAQIGRNKKNNQNLRDRIRNYWSRIKLTKNGEIGLRAKIHDIIVNVYE